ncbi:hypothetical protein PO124_05590 [Bacillus licheniformis]|nr:hypothetical protein [Bacillus licheniformis]
MDPFGGSLSDYQRTRDELEQLLRNWRKCLRRNLRNRSWLRSVCKSSGSGYNRHDQSEVYNGCMLA